MATPATGNECKYFTSWEGRTLLWHPSLDRPVETLESWKKIEEEMRRQYNLGTAAGKAKAEEVALSLMKDTAMPYNYRSNAYVIIALSGKSHSLQVAKGLIKMAGTLFRKDENPFFAADMWKANLVLEIAEREAEETEREAEREREREAARALEQLKNTKP